MSTDSSKWPDRLRQSPVSLTIAGSDSCGGAGLQADLKTFVRLDTYGASVVTAVTAQNTQGVSAVDVMTDKLVVEQLQRVLADLPVAAVKTGMLANQSIITAVARHLRQAVTEETMQLVVDPVMVATSGARLLDERATTSLRDELLPLATLVTPNLPEAEALTGLVIDDPDTELRAGEAILAMGPGAVLLKGGHGKGDVVTDVLMTGSGHHRYQSPRKEGEYHGTGCVLSAAITAYLARGESLEQAVEKGLEFLQQRLNESITGDPLALALLP